MKTVKPLSQQGLVKPNGCVNCLLLAHKTSTVLRFRVWDHYNKAWYSDTKVCLKLCQKYKSYYNILYYTILKKSSGPYCTVHPPAELRGQVLHPHERRRPTILSTNNCLSSCQNCLLVGIRNPITLWIDRGKTCNICTATYPILVLRFTDPSAVPTDEQENSTVTNFSSQIAVITPKLIPHN